MDKKVTYAEAIIVEAAIKGSMDLKDTAMRILVAGNRSGGVTVAAMRRWPEAEVIAHAFDYHHARAIRKRLLDEGLPARNVRCSAGVGVEGTDALQPTEEARQPFDAAFFMTTPQSMPAELVLEMLASWKKGNNVVLAVRDGRDESKGQTFFANFYYKLVQKTALPEMPDQGFDVYLIDRKVIDVLNALDEKNSALTGQILWSGFKTDKVYYHRLAREIGKSRWTLKKKIRLVMDTLFSFTDLPITIVLDVGFFSIIGALIWAVTVLAAKITGSIEVSGWTTLFIFQLFSFGVIMMTLGILGEYLWRCFDASRNRPPFIIEDEYQADGQKDDHNTENG